VVKEQAESGNSPGKTEQVAAVKPDLERLLVIATTLDHARARYSFGWANPPRYIDRSVGETITCGGCVIPPRVAAARTRQPVVPIDLLIQPQIRVVTITGPNTGENRYIENTGLGSLDGESGLFVPAREPVELPWFDLCWRILGMSSRWSRAYLRSPVIRRISQILSEMTGNSLVLLDEVGAGTDPVEGSLSDRAAIPGDHAQLSIATTHFGELRR